jgi:hypothetical protein
MKKEVYGSFSGGDPRTFTPDVECCHPDEIEAHRKACEEWDEADKKGIKLEPIKVSRIISFRPFGIGITTLRRKVRMTRLIFLLCAGSGG